jgi:hypothetical protein
MRMGVNPFVNFLYLMAYDLLPMHLIAGIPGNIAWRRQSGIHAKYYFVPGFDCRFDIVIHSLIVQVEQHFFQFFTQHVIQFSAFPIIK